MLTQSYLQKYTAPYLQTNSEVNTKTKYQFHIICLSKKVKIIVSDLICILLPTFLFFVTYAAEMFI